LADDNFSRGVKARAFGLTWLSYATYYLTRKNYAIAKAGIQQSLKVSSTTLGTIDMVYSIGYAAGQFASGALADRIGPRRVLVVGMLLTAGASVWFGFSSLPLVFLLAWGLNGLAQSTGWSPNIKAMTPFFGRVGRGAVMGAWTTCYIVGGLVANPVAEYFDRKHGWRAVFWGPVAFTVLVALALLFLLPRPAPPPVDAAEKARVAEERRAARREVLRQPLLWALGSSYFFMKLTRYVFWFWAPFYMKTVLHYSSKASAYTPLLFEIGGFTGALTIGWVSDRFLRGRRVPAATVGLLFLALALVVYGWAAPLGLWPNMIALFFVGFFLFGPDAIVSATAAQDLGGVAAAAIAAGVINGVGSIGQIASGPIIPLLSAGGNWTVVWWTLAAGALVGMTILIPFWKSRR
jgi:sugar phosphate permease